MKNLKYHILNIISIMFFSYMLASTITQIIKYNISPTSGKANKGGRKPFAKNVRKSFDDYKTIIESGFFPIADPSVNTDGPGQVPIGEINELTLIGTITGPANIARAMILKRGEKNPGIFALYKINRETTNDVYGYKLVRIASSKIYLDNKGEKVPLELYAKKEISSGSTSSKQISRGRRITKTLSRAEIKQKVLNNMDNALRGLRAGPYRVNNQVQGYKIMRVRPSNILYKLGVRSGDIIKRVNGRAIDSTKKLYSMWESLKTESRIVIDLERRRKIVTYEFIIKD